MAQMEEYPGTDMRADAKPSRNPISSESASIAMRWNFYFEPCAAVTLAGACVDLPEGHAIVTIEDDAASESVFFPAQVERFDLVTGVIALLEKRGLAQRFGPTWPASP